MTEGDCLRRRELERVTHVSCEQLGGQEREMHNDELDRAGGGVPIVPGLQPRRSTSFDPAAFPNQCQSSENVYFQYF